MTAKQFCSVGEKAFETDKVPSSVVNNISMSFVKITPHHKDSNVSNDGHPCRNSGTNPKSIVHAYHVDTDKQPQKIQGIINE